LTDLTFSRNHFSLNHKKKKVFIDPSNNNSFSYLLLTTRTHIINTSYLTKGLTTELNTSYLTKGLTTEFKKF